MDNENVLNRCRKGHISTRAVGLAKCGCHRAHLVVAHDAFVATQRITDFVCRTKFDSSGCLRAWQRRTIHDQNILTEVRR